MLVALPFAGLIHAGTDLVIGLLVLGVVCMDLDQVLEFDLIVREGGPAASTITYLFSPVSVLLGAVFLGEPLGWTVLVGAAMVLVTV